jgi:hypothetical protein
MRGGGGNQWKTASRYYKKEYPGLERLHLQSIEVYLSLS